MIVAAVPVKDLDHAKQRLLGVLNAGERRALTRAMLQDVLRALAAAPVDAVWVVSGDPEVAALARARGIETLREAENRGHTAAVASAQAEARRRGAQVFLTIPGDVPGARPEEIAALARAPRTSGPPAAAFVPSRSGRGTNGVALRPPDAMPLTFGEPSFEAHVRLARERGLGPRVLSLPGLALDIDHPQDLAVLLARDPTTESGHLVRTWDLASRLNVATFERRLRRRNPVEAPSD